MYMMNHDIARACSSSSSSHARVSIHALVFFFVYTYLVCAIAGVF